MQDACRDLFSASLIISAVYTRVNRQIPENVRKRYTYGDLIMNELRRADVGARRAAPPLQRRGGMRRAAKPPASRIRLRRIRRAAQVRRLHCHCGWRRFDGVGKAAGRLKAAVTAPKRRSSLKTHSGFLNVGNYLFAAKRRKKHVGKIGDEQSD